LLRPVLPSFFQAHPAVQVEMSLNDGFIDIVENGFDAGIRLGESLRDGMTAVRIKPRLRFSVVGSPAYFERHPIPRTPTELNGHVCIRNLYPSGVPYAWEFKHGGRTIEFNPTGPIATDDHELMVQAALAGTGLACVWENRAEREIAEGRLVRCLEPWCAPEDWLYIYYPTRKYLSAGLRAVIQALRA